MGGYIHLPMQDADDREVTLGRFVNDEMRLEGKREVGGPQASDLSTASFPIQQSAADIADAERIVFGLLGTPFLRGVVENPIDIIRRPRRKKSVSSLLIAQGPLHLDKSIEIKRLRFAGLFALDDRGADRFKLGLMAQ